MNYPKIQACNVCPVKYNQKYLSQHNLCVPIVTLELPGVEVAEKHESHIENAFDIRVTFSMILFNSSRGFPRIKKGKQIIYL